METKKCMWCLKEYETNSKEKYCSVECEIKNEKQPKDKLKKGFIAIIGDFFGSLFS